MKAPCTRGQFEAAVMGGLLFLGSPVLISQEFHKYRAPVYPEDAYLRTPFAGVRKSLRDHRRRAHQSADEGSRRHLVLCENSAEAGLLDKSAVRSNRSRLVGPRNSAQPDGERCPIKRALHRASLCMANLPIS